jgi:translation initiation factor 3 subunit A
MKVGRVQDACEVLHNAISKRGGRTSVWTTEHEEMFIEFINLAVELRDPRRAKDGMYHYRQLAQTQAPASLDKVANYLVNLASRKTTEARARADVDSTTELADIDDLEEGQQAPEALLMGAVTSEGSRERAEREILLPWVRHMWDTYRNVLDNLRYTPKLEHVYHAIAVKAMRFCKAYNRGPEFRKLCRMLRDHLVSSRRQLEQTGAAMSDESVERHLTTRFVQLESCADMSLWNEGFRTVEEIYGTFLWG